MDGLCLFFTVFMNAAIPIAAVLAVRMVLGVGGLMHVNIKYAWDLCFFQ